MKLRPQTSSFRKLLLSLIVSSFILSCANQRKIEQVATPPQVQAPDPVPDLGSLQYSDSETSSAEEEMDELQSRINALSTQNQALGQVLTALNARVQQLEEQSAPILLVGEHQNLARDLEIPIVLPTAGILTVNAHGAARYLGTIQNAGIIVQVRIDGVVCAQDMAFEGESASITFQASASCSRGLPAGPHLISVTIPTHYNGMDNYELRAQHVALRLPAP